MKLNTTKMNQPKQHKENSMQIPKDAMAEEEWNKEFENLVYPFVHSELIGDEKALNQIKSFISSLITQAKKQGYEKGIKAGQEQQMNRKIYQGILEDARQEERKKVLGEVRNLMKECPDCKAQGVTEMTEVHINQFLKKLN